MRTVIVLDDELHRRAKAYADRHGTTLAALVREALRMRLAQPNARKQPARATQTNTESPLTSGLRPEPKPRPVASDWRCACAR
jgi:hypothetical protein